MEGDDDPDEHDDPGERDAPEAHAQEKGETVNPAHARAIREAAYRDVARSFRGMSIWKRLKLALFARWY